MSCAGKGGGKRFLHTCAGSAAGGSLPQSSLRDASSLQQSRAACSPRPAGANPTDSSTALPKLGYTESSVR